MLNAFASIIISISGPTAEFTPFLLSGSEEECANVCVRQPDGTYRCKQVCCPPKTLNPTLCG